MKKRQPSVKANFIYNSIYQLTAIIIPIITTPYLSRILGAEGIGIYGFGYSIANYFAMFIKLGLNNYGAREIAYIRDDQELLSVTFWEMYLFQLAVGLTISVTYFVYGFVFSNNRTIALIFILYVISAMLDITWFFWGIEEFRLTVKRDFIIKILTTVGIFLLVKTADDTWKYCLLLCGGFLLSQMLLWPNLKGVISWRKPTLSGIKRHIKPNFVLFIPIIAISLYKTMDKIMLGIMSTSAEVGYYHNSENIIQVPTMLIYSLGTVMQPRMSNMVSNQTSESVMESVFMKSIILAMFLSSSVGFGIMTVANEFVPLFYGPGFEKCIQLYIILLPSCLFLAFANVIRTQYLIPRKKDREYIISLFSGAGVNLVLNAMLIPRFQSVGASIGTLAAEATVCIIQAALMRKEKSMKKYIVQSSPYVVAGLLMFLLWNHVSFPISNMFFSMLIKIALAGTFYLIVLFVLLSFLEKTEGIELKPLDGLSMVFKKRNNRC